MNTTQRLAAFVFLLGALVVVTPSPAFAALGGESFTADEPPVPPASQTSSFQITGDGHNRAGGDLRDLPYDFSSVPDHLWAQLNQAMRPNSYVLCMNSIIDKILSYATFDPPGGQCTATNVCSGGLNGGNVVNSCTGDLVTSCPNGCSGGMCNPGSCVPHNVCSGGDVVNSCTGALVEACAFSCGAGMCGGPGSPGSPQGPLGPTGTPDCSDDVDNDGDGLTNYPDDPGCTGPNDFDEFDQNPNAQLTLNGSSLVRFGTAVTLTWTAVDVRAGSCRINGTNGDAWTLTGGSGSVVTSALASETRYTLTCLNLDSEEVSVGFTVKIVPSYREI